MFQIDRFLDAEDVYQKVVDAYQHEVGIVAILLNKADLDSKVNPGGPEFVILAKRKGEIKKKRKKGLLPTTIDSALETIQIKLAKGEFIPLSGGTHTSESTILTPGDSIGDKRGGTGTLGAKVKTKKSGSYFITAGHVVEGGTNVFQSSIADGRRAGRDKRIVGKVIDNAIKRRVNDVALIQLNPGVPITNVPHDTPAPSAGNPAVGIYAGYVSTGKRKWRAFYHINKALIDVGASLDHTLQVSTKNYGQTVRATGRTSGEINGKISGMATIEAFGAGGGFKIPGFLVEEGKGGVEGDSGAVSTINVGVTINVKENGPQIDASATDVDPVEEYLPGTIPEVDSLFKKRQPKIKVGKSKLSVRQARDVIANISAKLETLGELEVIVGVTGYKNPCVEGETLSRPTPCEEVILRPEKETPDRKGDRQNEEPDVVNPSGTCCTFGKVPYVTISGDDSERLEFELSVIGTASIKILYSIEQKVMSADFNRYGVCHKNICSKEVIKGHVMLSRKIAFELSGSVGEVELPIFGKVNAGTAAFKHNAVTSVRKNFSIPCGLQDEEEE